MFAANVDCWCRCLLLSCSPLKMRVKCCYCSLLLLFTADAADLLNPRRWLVALEMAIIPDQGNPSLSPPWCASIGASPRPNTLSAHSVSRFAPSIQLILSSILVFSLTHIDPPWLCRPRWSHSPLTRALYPSASLPAITTAY